MKISDYFTLRISILAIIFSFVTWIKSRNDTTYDVFDITYFDILKVAIDNPSFRDCALTSNYLDAFNDEERRKYEIYAFICFNFCETIYDKGNRNLTKTWKPILAFEIQLHRCWFEKNENSANFKKEFRDFIIDKL